MPASEFAQKQVGIVSGIADVVQDGSTAQFTGVIHDDVAKTKNTLRNAGRNGDILYFAEWDVPRCAGYQTRVNFQFGVRHCIADHIAPDVVVGGY